MFSKINIKREISKGGRTIKERRAKIRVELVSLKSKIKPLRQKEIIKLLVIEYLSIFSKN
jgi:hypothetical protein